MKTTLFMMIAVQKLSKRELMNGSYLTLKIQTVYNYTWDRR